MIHRKNPTKCELMPATGSLQAPFCQKTILVGEIGPGHQEAVELLLHCGGGDEYVWHPGDPLGASLGLSPPSSACE